MGTGWLSGILKSKQNVIETNFPGNNILEITYEKNHWDEVKIKIYMPDLDEYQVTQDVVDKALELGAVAIVCDNWCKPSAAAISYANEKNIKIYKSGHFISLIEKGNDV